MGAKAERDARQSNPTRPLLSDLGAFFIVGAPRSGTTLLRTMLSAHPHICIPHETEFFMQVKPGLRGDALRQVFLRYAKTTAFVQQELDAAEILGAIDDRELDSRSLFLEMMRRHADLAGKIRVGEKSPHHCRHVERIAADLPQAKFIHIYRDVRDVAASRVQLAWSSPSVMAHARSWARIVREHRRLLRVMPPERYCEVRFETLVSQPEPELRRLCAFLGEDFVPEMLRFDEHARDGLKRGETAWSGVTPLPLDGRAVGRHGSRLTDRQIDAVQRVAGKEMALLGYQQVRIKRRASWALLNAREQFDYRMNAIRKIFAKRLGAVPSTPNLEVVVPARKPASPQSSRLAGGNGVGRKRMPAQ